MADQSFSNQFRVASNTDQNLLDRVAPGAAGLSAWTLGGTLIDRVGLQPGINQDWKILSVEFSLGLSFEADPVGAGGPCYGKIGQLIGALLPSAPNNPTQGQGTPWQNPMQAFPQDLSLMVKLFDGETDSIPSNAGTVNPNTFVTGGLNLPQPIIVYGGTQLAIGLWLTPCLAKLGGNNEFVGLFCRRGRYTINYDDGL